MLFFLIDQEDVPVPPALEQTTPMSLHTSTAHVSPFHTLGTNNIEQPSSYRETTTEPLSPTYNEAMEMQS